MAGGGHYLGAASPLARLRADRGPAHGGRPVLLDGGVATELQQVQSEDRAPRRAVGDVGAVPGADGGARGAPPLRGRRLRRDLDQHVVGARGGGQSATGPAGGRNPLWLDAARLGVRLARQAIDEAGRGGECAAAFCINSALLDERAPGRLELLSWLWHDEPPDLVILETLEAIPDDAGARDDRDGVRHGPAGVGQLPPPAPRACPTSTAAWSRTPIRRVRAGAERLERIGVKAILVNCVPADELARPWRAARADLAADRLLPEPRPRRRRPAGSSTARRPARSTRAWRATWIDAGARSSAAAAGSRPSRSRACARRWGSRRRLGSGCAPLLRGCWRSVAGRIACSFFGALGRTKLKSTDEWTICCAIGQQTLQSRPLPPLLTQHGQA